MAICCISLALSTASCSNDDDNNDPSEPITDVSARFRVTISVSEGLRDLYRLYVTFVEPDGTMGKKKLLTEPINSFDFTFSEFPVKVGYRLSMEFLYGADTNSKDFSFTVNDGIVAFDSKGDERTLIPMSGIHSDYALTGNLASWYENFKATWDGAGASYTIGNGSDGHLNAYIE